MSQFVDKRWQELGIDLYSVEEILATLRHYGVETDAASLKTQAEAHYPMNWARSWHQGWKGVGQFSRFPGAAAQELWRRMMPDALAPTDLALALVKLCENADEVLKKKNEATFVTRFEVAERLAGKLPERSARRDEFMEELVAAMGDWVQAFDHFPTALARAQRLDDANRMVRLDEKVFEVRAGISSALLLEQTGQREAAINQLEQVTKDSERHVLNRLHANEALYDFGAHAQALSGMRLLMQAVVQLKHREWASELGAVLLRWNENQQSASPLHQSVRSMMEELVSHFDAPRAASDSAASAQPETTLAP